MAESRGTVRAVFEAVDRVTAPVRRIGAGVTSLVRNLNLASAREQIGRVVRGLADVGRAAIDMGRRLVLGATGGAVAMVALTRSVAESTRAAQIAARGVNVTLRGWQSFGHAASLVGSNAEQMGGALGSLRDKALEAARGNAELRMAFRSMGVQLTDGHGRLRDTESLMLDVADAFARVPDSERRTRAAMELFGEAGAALIPVLAQGSAGLRAAAHDAQFLGLVLGQAEAGAVTAFGTSMRRLTGSITGVWNAIAVRLAPILTPLVDDLTQWIAVNRELIATRVEEYIRAIPGAVQSLRDQAVGLWAALRPVVATFGEWLEWFGPLNAAALLLGIRLGGGLLVAVLRLTNAIAGPMFGAIIGLVRHLRTGIGVVAAFNAVLIANPIGLIVAAVVLLGGAAYLLYRNWSSIPGWFKALWGGVQQAFDGFVTWVRGWARGALSVAVAVITTVWRVLAIWFNTLWRTWVVAPFNWFVTWVDGWTGGAATAARDRFLAVWRGVRDFFTDLWDGIEARFLAVWEPIRRALEQIEGLFSRPANDQPRGVPPGRNRGSLHGAGAQRIPDDEWGGPLAPSVQPAPANGAPRVDAGGVIELRITDDRVTIRRAEANNPGIRFRPSDDTGRILATD